MVAVVELAALSGLLGVMVSEVHFYVLRKRERILRRAARLTHAAQNLDAHTEAFEKFVNDAASPSYLKDILIHFGDAISNQDTAIQCAKALIGDKAPSIPDEAHTVMGSLNELRSHRSDLAEAFDITIMSGVMYMLLRWPETAQVFEEAASGIASDPTKGVGFATKAARLQSKGPAIHAGSFGSPPVMAGA